MAKVNTRVYTMRRVYGVWISGFKAKEKLAQYIESCSIRHRKCEIECVMGMYSWMGRIAEGDPSLAKVSKKYILSEDIEYSEQEILQSRLLYLEIRGVDSKGDTGPDDGNSYDYSFACESCLSGAILIPPFRLLNRDLPKKYSVAETNMGELLVSSIVANDLEIFTEKDNWLVRVEDFNNGSCLPWKLVQPSAILPKMNSKTKGFTQLTNRKNPSSACTICMRDSYGTTLGTAFEPVFSMNEVASSCVSWIALGQDVPDAACSQELVGPGMRPDISAKRRVAQPLIFVSQRVARVLRKHANEWIRLTPVKFVN